MADTLLPDLGPMCTKIEAVLIKHLHLSQRPALALCFACELTQFDGVHWGLNVDSLTGASLFKRTAETIIRTAN